MFDLTTVAEPATVLRMVAHALTLGLPAPTAVTLTPVGREVRIHVSPGGWEEWRCWWNRNYSGPWKTTVETARGWSHHRTIGAWRGWRIEILHLVPVEGVKP